MKDWKMDQKQSLEKIVENLKNKTIIIIAHRLETIKDVDLIYVLEDGKIKESGNYDELMLKEDGAFVKLYNANL